MAVAILVQEHMVWYSKDDLTTTGHEQTSSPQLGAAFFACVNNIWQRMANNSRRPAYWVLTEETF